MDNRIRIDTAPQTIGSCQYEQIMWMKGQNIAIESFERGFAEVAALGKIQCRKIEIGQPAEFKVCWSIGIMATAMADAVS